MQVFPAFGSGGYLFVDLILPDEPFHRKIIHLKRLLGNFKEFGEVPTSIKCILRLVS